MDECHHTKKGFPQANIMRRYLEHKAEGAASKVPQVIGLTASPGAGENPDLDERKTIDHLINLCAHMNAIRGIMIVVNTKKSSITAPTHLPLCWKYFSDEILKSNSSK